MMARWQYADPAPPAAGDGRFTRAAVAGAERWAWAGEFRGRRAEFFYDGFEFWHQLRSGERWAVPPSDAPTDGWWHRPSCNCPLCAVSIAPDRRRQGIGANS
jgi:hypothetical protein